MPEPTATTRPRNARRIGVLVVVASFVGIWGYVMYLTVFEGRAEPRDRLSDQAFTARAEAACRQHRARVDDLPLASEVRTPDERADLLDRATDELDLMIDDLRDLEPPVGDEGVAVGRWLDDWEQYLIDRREYAAAQRDPTHPRYDRAITVTDRGGFQIDVLVDDFARINYMESCETPDDV